MSILRRIVALAVPVALAVLIGCGGGGGNPGGGGGSPSALTRERVKSGFGQTLIGLAQSGMMPTGAAGVGTGGSTGAGGGLPFVGAFIRDFMPGLGGPLARIRGRDGGTDGGVGTSGGSGGGGGELPEIYFDEYLGLWVEWEWTDSASTTHLYEDEAKTKPAGSFVTTYSFEGDFTSTFEITAGPFSGAHGRYETVVHGEEGVSGETTYDNTWPTWGHDEGNATWSPSGSSWHHRSEGADGAWFEADGAFRADGSGTSSGSDSQGYRYAFTYNADGSGRGRVEGPEAGLPCTITWQANVTTRIVWADGTVEEFDPSDWYGEGGTTGGTGGGDGGVAAMRRG
jgi:hypothetical protein